MVNYIESPEGTFILNIIATSKRALQRGPEQYREFTRMRSTTPLHCQGLGCNKVSSVIQIEISHVMICDGTRKEYGVPLCGKHNGDENTGLVPLKKGARLVPITDFEGKRIDETAKKAKEKSRKG